MLPCEPLGTSLDEAGATPAAERRGVQTRLAAGESGNQSRGRDGRAREFAGLP